MTSTDHDLRDLELRTPCCNRKLTAPFFQAATIVIRRTCRRCRSKFVVKVAPLPSPKRGMWLHEITWTPTHN